MLVRTESVVNSSTILIIDEIGRYIGQIEEWEFFLECVTYIKDPIEEEGYTFFFVNEKCLNKNIIK